MCSSFNYKSYKVRTNNLKPNIDILLILLNMKSQLNTILSFLTITIIFGFQCNKGYIEPIAVKELFMEKVNLFPAKKTYNINDTIWLTFSTTNKTLFDSISNQRLSTSGLKFNFKAIVLPLHNTPTNFSNSYCRFIVTSNVMATYDTTKFNSLVNFDIGCDTLMFYEIKLGLVLKYSGTYLLNLSDIGTKFKSCGNQINPYPMSDLRFTYNLADCNKDVFLQIPLSERPEYPVGFRQAQIDARISFAFKVQ